MIVKKLLVSILAGIIGGSTSRLCMGSGADALIVGMVIGLVVLFPLNYLSSFVGVGESH